MNKFTFPTCFGELEIHVDLLWKPIRDIMDGGRNRTIFHVSLFKLYCANQNVPTDNYGEIWRVIDIKSIKKNDHSIYLWTNVLCLRETVIEKFMEM